MKQLRPGDRFLRGRDVRLIDQNNEQVGIVTFETALARAQQAGLDLVLVPSKTEPPVTRIMDFGKFLLHGDKVRVLLQFRGREMSHQDLGMQIMTRFIKELDDVAKQDSPVRQDRKTFSTTLSVRPEARAAAKKEAAKDQAPEPTANDGIPRE